MAVGFVDSSAWIALSIARDVSHARATEFFRSRRADRFVTSNAVIAEATTWMVYHGGRVAALALRDRLEAAEHIRMLTVEWVTPDIHQRAWHFIERYPDQRFSFTDCTSFALCERLGVDYVFGFDVDFVIAGFTLAPASDYRRTR